MLKGVSYANFGRFMQCFGPYFSCVLREFMFIIKTTNKFAMNSRQPDSGLRQYNCTGPGQVVGPTWPKVYKNTLITWRQLPSLSLEVEGDRGAPGTPAHPCTKRCGRRRSGRGQRCWT